MRFTDQGLFSKPFFFSGAAFELNVRGCSVGQALEIESKAVEVFAELALALFEAGRILSAPAASALGPTSASGGTAFAPKYAQFAALDVTAHVLGVLDPQHLTCLELAGLASHKLGRLNAAIGFYDRLLEGSTRAILPRFIAHPIVLAI
jgi:hypothetical protein